MKRPIPQSKGLPMSLFSTLILSFSLLFSTAYASEKSVTISRFAPIINGGQAFLVEEGSASGTIVGNVAATDASQYTITSAQALSTGTPNNDSPVNAMQMFSINNNGQLSVNDPTFLLASVSPVILNVSVSNAQGQTASAEVEINIQDVTVPISVNENASWATGTPQPLGNSEGQSEIVNGKLYSFSGFDIEKRPAYTPTDRVYVYDPQQQNWTLLNPMPKMHPNSAHGGATHAGFTTDGTDIYFAGGYAANANGNGQIFGTRYVYKYMVATDTYERLPDLPQVRAGGGLEYIAGKLYYFGGSNSARTEDQGDLFVLDLNNLGAGWSLLSDSPLPNPRNHLGSAVVDGKLYVIGGQHQQDERLTTQDDVHQFDPNTGQWTKVTDMPDIDEVPDGLSPGKGHITNSTFAYGGYIFVLGGEYQYQGPYSKSVLAYDPATDRWIRYPDMPTVRSSGIAGIIDGKLYYSTGRNSSTTYVGTLSNPPTPPTTENEGIWLESECATVGGNWNTENLDAASGGSYVTIRPGLNSYSPPNDSYENYVRHPFTISQSGLYHVFARVRASNYSKDSFWVRLDGGEWQQWNVSPTTSTFAWREIDVLSPELSANSSHTLDIAYREDGTDLDKMYISQSAAVPSGMGESAENCGGNDDNEAPEASFTVSDRASFAPVEIRFDASNSSDDKGIVSYIWDFDDGNGDRGVEVSHTYLEGGEYYPTLTVYDAEGLVDQYSLNISITDAPYEEGAWLEAECHGVPNNWNVENSEDASGGRYVTIRPGLNSYSSAPNNPLTFEFNTYESGTQHIYARVRASNYSNDSFWVRLDGGEWQQWNVSPTTSTFAWREITVLPFSAEVGTTHKLDIAYREDGTDLDKIFVSSSPTPPSDLGAVDVWCNPPPMNYDPVASFTASPLTGTTPLTVNFDASASTDDDDIIAHMWDFGDGNSGFGEFESHIYTEAGEYTVVLYVEDRQGAHDYDSATIVVEGPEAVTELWLEAECAEVGANWRIVSDDNASGGSYVVVPNRNSYSPPADVPENYVRFQFSLSTEGSYYIFARIRALNSGDDSFFIRANGGSWVQWAQYISIGSNFNWNESAGSPFNLLAGNNTIDIAYRESGTWLDKLHLNLTGLLPAGQGGTATNCNGSTTNFEQEVLSLKAYPNALEESNYLNVQSSRSFGRDVSANLYDQAGRLIMSNVRISEQAASELTLDFSAIPLGQGVYFLKIQEDTFTKPQVLRFIKK